MLGLLLLQPVQFWVLIYLMPEASGTLLTHSGPSAFRPRKQREIIVDIDADVD